MEGPQTELGCRVGKTSLSILPTASVRNMFISLLLPLLFVLLLPSLKLEPQTSNQYQNHLHNYHQTQTITTTTMSRLLLALARLPLDRLRLSSGLAVGALAAIGTPHLEENATNRKQHLARRSQLVAPMDLLEEETSAAQQLQAEHRTMGSGGGGGGNRAHQHYQQLMGGPPRPSPQRAAELVQASSSSGYTTSETAGGQQLDGGGGPQEYGGAPGESDAGGPVGSVVESPADSAVGSGSSSGTGALQARADLPAVRALNVKCEKNHMTVNIVFDRPFYGMVFSKGHYNDQKCVHLPANSGQTSVNFDIHLGKCGMSSSIDGQSQLQALQHQQQAANHQQPNGQYIENTIIIQYDPQVQEIYDQARKLRCTWYDFYEKSVTFRPYNVDMLDAVTANFLGDNIQCWMQIQVGKGPWSSEVAGIVKIGQTMTMVLAIKDDENKFDMLVRNCVAHDGKHQPIQLVDEFGCVARPKIMGKFQKVKNFGPAATVVSYAHFQAFKFPDSMSVHFQCVIQVCRSNCPEPMCQPPGGELGGSNGGENSNGPPAAATDYAVSGTEMVASKESLLPAGISHHHHQQQHYLQQQQPSFPTQSNSSQGSAVNFRLDESLGRVQVKLDTSMVAGGAVRPAAAALPPHLLHSASDSASINAAQVPVYAAPARTYQASSSPHLNGRRPPPSSISAGRAGQSIVNLRAGSPTRTTSSAAGPAHFSSPYPQAALLQHRLGDLSAAAGDPQLALSMIAQPRALNPPPGSLAHLNTGNVFTISNHHGQQRKRRAVNLQQLEPTTTAIKTQKTIQVVSPDDMAFSLASSQFDSMFDDQVRASKFATGQANTVCFSAARLAAAILVTLAALATSIVLVSFILVRQRRQLRQEEAKLAKHLQPAGDCATVSPQQQQPHLVPSNTVAGGYFNGRQQAELSATDVARRQAEEMRQRQNYLARLYSQFVPAHYWRQAD